MLIAWARSVGCPSAYVWKRLARGLEMVLSESVNSLKTKAAIATRFRREPFLNSSSFSSTTFSFFPSCSETKKNNARLSPPFSIHPSRAKDAAARNAPVVGACALDVLVVARRRRCCCCCCCSYQRRRSADGDCDVVSAAIARPFAPSGLGAAGAAEV